MFCAGLFSICRSPASFLGWLDANVLLPRGKTNQRGRRRKSRSRQTPQCVNNIAVHRAFQLFRSEFTLPRPVQNAVAGLGNRLSCYHVSVPKAPNSAAISVPMLDLKRQYEPLQQELLRALQHVLETQQFILGEQVASFEKAAAGIGEGDAVITTPFSFFASVSAILRAGARPVLADIDPVTFNLDPAAVETVLKAPQPVPIRAVLPVHLYGQCADWDGFSR